MTTMWKWFVASLFLIIFVVWAGYNNVKQMGITEATSLVDPVSETIALGAYRGELKDDGKWNREIPTVDVGELQANVIAKANKEQYNTKYGLTIDMSLVDSKGSPIDSLDKTTLKQVRGIQYLTYFTEGNQHKFVDKEQTLGSSQRLMLQDTLADK